MKPKALRVKKKEQKGVSDQDKMLFRESVYDVTPIEEPNRIDNKPKIRHPLAKQRMADEAEVMEEMISTPLDPEIVMESGEESFYRRNGVSQQTVRKLRRGFWKIEGHLDLHGYTRVEAKHALTKFLTVALANRWRCVRVVHGKGLGSKNREPVLKKKLVVWLQRLDVVLAFCQAPASDGGSGATLVLLKSNKKNP